MSGISQHPTFFYLGVPGHAEHLRMVDDPGRTRRGSADTGRCVACRAEPAGGLYDRINQLCEGCAVIRLDATRPPNDQIWELLLLKEFFLLGEDVDTLHAWLLNPLNLFRTEGDGAEIPKVAWRLEYFAPVIRIPINKVYDPKDKPPLYYVRPGDVDDQLHIYPRLLRLHWGSSKVHIEQFWEPGSEPRHKICGPSAEIDKEKWEIGLGRKLLNLPHSPGCEQLRGAFNGKLPPGPKLGSGQLSRTGKTELACAYWWLSDLFGERAPSFEAIGDRIASVSGETVSRRIRELGMNWPPRVRPENYDKRVLRYGWAHRR
jgi:hypothetical protein